MVNDRTSAQILVVDDDAELRGLVAEALAGEGFAVDEAADAMEAFAAVAERAPDLVILDMVLPVITGLEVLQNLRQRSASMPILVLSGLDAEEARVRGLQLGADDYVTKPFSPRELVARVRALLRRAMASSPQAASISFDGLVIDVNAREVWVHGRFVETTAKEFDLLAFLGAHPGRVFTRHELLREVWRSSSEWQQEGTVTEFVRRLRSKIEDDAEHPQWLQTVRGVGYRFERRRDGGVQASSPAAVTLQEA